MPPTWAAVSGVSTSATTSSRRPSSGEAFLRRSAAATGRPEACFDPEPPLLLCAGRVVAESRDDQFRQRRHRFRPSRIADHGHRPWLIASTACVTTTCSRGWRRRSTRPAAAPPRRRPATRSSRTTTRAWRTSPNDLTPTIGAGSVGWKMNLQDVGEKVLAESRTFQNEIYFTSYSPQQRDYDPGVLCCDRRLNRLYVVDAATASRWSTSIPRRQACPASLIVSGNFSEAASRRNRMFVFPTPDAIQDHPNRPVPAVAPVLPGRPRELRQRTHQPAGADLLGTARPN